MRYLALACDYDGTLALRGRVDEPTLAALERVRATGRRLVMVTGRQLDDLAETFDHFELFDRIVAENGGLLYNPTAKTGKVLAAPPSPEFVELLRSRGVVPVSVGRSIVATWRPHEHTVLTAIHDLGLELQVIFNKDAVMVLPSGVNKATGLTAVLPELGLSPHNVVGIGDAENDHAFLELCECSAAVANALPALREKADIATIGDHGAGVIELIDELVETDLAGREERLTRHHILLGTRADESEVEVTFPPYGGGLLVAGTSGSGKSSLITGLLERLGERGYQFCVIDPEGDYEGLDGALVLGDRQQAPSAEQVLHALASPAENLVVDLVAQPLADRPPFFQALLPRLAELRARTGRPHWLVVDEAHHLLPAAWEPGQATLQGELHSVLYITAHPAMIAPAALSGVATVVATGAEPAETLRQFAETIGVKPPRVANDDLPPGEVLVWRRDRKEAPIRVRVAPGQTVRRRHTRKYATGNLPPERSFYFRGPDGKLNLRAQNLFLFLQLADGVDDATWEHHLRQGDYTAWFRDAIKDEDLAAEAAAVAEDRALTPAESRGRIHAAVEAKYTLPATAPLPLPGTDAAPVHS
jgi:hydroxymethylpyrimidine pyrophosphatase-like HAD family hydrolase